VRRRAYVGDAEFLSLQVRAHSLPGQKDGTEGD
jgi:hypothetical protein